MKIPDNAVNDLTELTRPLREYIQKHFDLMTEVHVGVYSIEVLQTLCENPQIYDIGDSIR